MMTEIVFDYDELLELVFLAKMKTNLNVEGFVEWYFNKFKKEKVKTLLEEQGLA